MTPSLLCAVRKTPDEERWGNRFKNWLSSLMAGRTLESISGFEAANWPTEKSLLSGLVPFREAENASPATPSIDPATPRR